MAKWAEHVRLLRSGEGITPESVTLLGLLSQPTTQPGCPCLARRASASSTPKPTAAMRPPLMLCSGHMRPRW